MRRRRLVLWLATVVVLVCLPVAATSATPSTPSTPMSGPAVDGPLRVLLVGDSVTQGSAGDWTWRYRLWRHLTDEGGAVDLVGPRDDLFDNVTRVQGSHDYADPAFDRDHAARWGLTRAFLEEEWPIADLVRDHDPDVVVELLGYNDLRSLGHSAERVADDLATFVGAVRQVDPAVPVVLAHLPQTWQPQVSDLNDRLDALAGSLDRPDARVVVARTEEGFDRTDHTWDDVHPNARGEVLVAAAVADALASVGLARPYPRPVPVVPVGPRTAPVLAGTARDRAVELRWSRVPGADSVRIGLRDVTAATSWRELGAPARGTTVRLGGLVNGHQYAVRVHPAKGWDVARDVSSGVVRLTPLPPRPGAVTRQRTSSPERDRVVVEAGIAERAATYELQAARVTRCSAPATYRTVTTGLARPRVTWTTRWALVRVRLVARNLAGVGPGRSTCVRVR